MAINARLVKEALMKLLGSKSGPAMNSPEAPRTLPGNRANTEHPDFDPGDFLMGEGDFFMDEAGQFISPAETAVHRFGPSGQFVDSPAPPPRTRQQVEAGAEIYQGNIGSGPEVPTRNPGAVQTLDDMAADFKRVTGRDPTPEELRRPEDMQRVIEILSHDDDIPF